ncbi:hypothetical protein SAMN05192553_107129 [Cyclobacterium xiamenense]|uniref:Uncharacterized protein n=1 Tax=Cyclobacterium xiamenense TaxID=1297121 RepID=A0A1H7AKQ7_9BACT|nr:hypothetical protein SAMN05192553_107129 [Cyclobacterium xiamenense]
MLHSKSSLLRSIPLRHYTCYPQAPATNSGIVYFFLELKPQEIEEVLVLKEIVVMEIF